MAENSRLGEETTTKEGRRIKIIQYDNYNHIVVEFDDENKTKVNCTYGQFKKGNLTYQKRYCRIRETKYNNTLNIIVELNNKNKTRVKTQYGNFKNGTTSNPNRPTVLGVGITGEKYPAKIGNKLTKEYNTWVNMLNRCYSEEWKQKFNTYEEAHVCDEWLLYENFYEWLHSQENFEKWISTPRSGLDKDIISKGNKLYSPETCCLVPARINSLFIKADKIRGDLPIGVHKQKNSYRAAIGNEGETTSRHIGCAKNPIDAFYMYKKEKEKLIKQVAQEAYEAGEITKRCYESMMNYEVEITD